MIKHFFLSGHWIKALLRDYWFGIKENRTNKKLSGCCQRKCQTPESWERIDEDFLSGIEPQSSNRKQAYHFTRLFLWWVWQVKVMLAIFKTFKLKATKHSKIVQMSTLEKQGLIFEMVWETPCTKQGFSCSDETPW